MPGCGVSSVVRCFHHCANGKTLPVAKIMTIKFITALTLAVAAFAAALCFSATPGHATAGAEPWCLNDDEGNGHCNFATSQACLAAVASGSRGNCNENPSSPSAPAASTERHKRR
jgi:hypothetical protein